MIAWLSPNLVRLRKAGQKMRVLESRRRVDPAFARDRFGVRPAGGFQGRVDEFHRGHFESGMFRAQKTRQRLYQFVIGTAFARRLDQLRPDLDVAVTAGLINVIMLHEHRRGQHDIGPASRFGEELFVRGDEQIVA
jgi:hypothetical protein